MTKPADTEVSTSIALAATDKGEAKAPAPAKANDTEFKIAELRDGVAIIEMEDGRMFSAELPEGVEVRKRNAVELKFDERNKDGVPTGASVVKAL